MSQSAKFIRERHVARLKLPPSGPSESLDSAGYRRDLEFAMPQQWDVGVSGAGYLGLDSRGSDGPDLLRGEEREESGRRGICIGV